MSEIIFNEKATLQALKDLDLIMDRLVVEVKCEREHNGNWEDKATCECHGKGYTTRPATPEEVRELIEWIFTRHPSEGLMKIDEIGWYFLLSSGNKLRMVKNG